MKKQTTKMRPSEAKLSTKTSSLEVVTEAEMSNEQVLAVSAYHPAMRAVEGGQAFTKYITGEVDVFASVAILVEQIKEVKAGDLSCAEATLTAQANTLDLIFNSLARRAANSEMLNQYETFMRLALKAQSLCRTTYETLAEIKSPRPMAFIKQQNVGYNQQVNNAVPRAHEEISKPANELLEVKHGERLDNGTAGAAIGAHSRLETVGKVHRAEDTRGHGAVKRKRP